MSHILVTGGAGFIGAYFVLDWLREGEADAVVNVDKSTCAGSLASLASLKGSTRNILFAYVVRALCDLLDALRPKEAGSYRQQITFVADRPRDRRYTVDSRKPQAELGWTCKETFETGLRKTVHWHLDNQAWVANVMFGVHRKGADEKCA